MARAPRLQVTAQNDQVREGRITAGSGLERLAGSLRAFEPALNTFQERQQAKFIEAETTKGRQAALEEIRSTGELVKSGDLEFGDSRFARKAFKEQIGRNTGSRISQQLAQAFQEWEGKDTDDPEVVNSFISGVIREQTEGIDDPDVLAGLQPSLAQATNNLQARHRKLVSDRTTEGYLTETANELTFAIDDMVDDEGNFKTDAWNDRVEEIKQEATALGLTKAQFDEVVIDAVVAKATTTGDTEILDLLKVPRKDGTPPIAGKPNVAIELVNAKHRILGQQWRLESQSDTSRQKTQEAVRDGTRKRLVEAAFSPEGEGITPDMKQEIAQQWADAGLPLSQATSMIRNLERLSGGGGTQEWESDEDLDIANKAAFLDGDVDQIRFLIEQDRIPANKRASYLQAALSKSRQVESEVQSRIDEAGPTDAEKMAAARREVAGREGPRGAPAQEQAPAQGSTEEQSTPPLRQQIQRLTQNPGGFIFSKLSQRGIFGGGGGGSDASPPTEEEARANEARMQWWRRRHPELASVATNGKPEKLSPAHLDLVRDRIIQVGNERGMEEAIRLFSETQGVPEEQVRVIMFTGQEAEQTQGPAPSSRRSSPDVPPEQFLDVPPEDDPNVPPEIRRRTERAHREARERGERRRRSGVRGEPFDDTALFEGGVATARRVTEGEDDLSDVPMRIIAQENPDLARVATEGDPESLLPTDLARVSDRIMKLAETRGVDEAVRIFSEREGVPEDQLRIVLTDGSE